MTRKFECRDSFKGSFLTRRGNPDPPIRNVFIASDASHVSPHSPPFSLSLSR